MPWPPRMKSPREVGVVVELDAPCLPTVTLDPGSMWLVDDRLGVMELSCEVGYIVTNFQIGWPTERPVVRARALADGLYDDSRYVGGRAITVSIRLDHRKATTQSLLDRLAAYLGPRKRPTLAWSLAGSSDDVRTLVVRGVDMPTVITGPKYQTAVMSLLASEPYTRSMYSHCHTIMPSQEGAVGRTYDLVFPRVYEFSLPTGAFNVPNYGNAPTDWVGTIFAEVTDPGVSINGVKIQFTGLTLLPQQTLVIDTAAKTMLLNGDVNESRYNLSNFTEWSWDDLLLQPGDNMVRLTGEEMSAEAAFTICLYDRWLT